MMYYNGFYPSSMFWGLGSLFHILFWVVLIYLLIQVFKHSKHSFKNDRSQDILKERYVKDRNRLLSALYKGILKPVLFLLDPEDIHDFFVRFGAFLGKFSPIRWKISKLFDYRNEKLSQKILGIDFRNPVGLAAGFDKDIELTDIISSLGFGFEEVGSITAKACDGNPRPRLWRLPKTKSLGVWYGLKNKGAKILSKKLANKIHQLPIGVNIAFTNCKENLDIPSAISDYVTGIQVMEK